MQDFNVAVKLEHCCHLAIHINIATKHSAPLIPPKRLTEPVIQYRLMLV